MNESLRTLLDVLNNSKKKFGENVFLKYKKNDFFESINYNRFIELINAMSGALFEIGVKKGNKIGIISENMYKWLIADMAIISLGAIDVPRGSDSTPQELLYILKHSEVELCFVENPVLADKILSIIKDLPKLKSIVLFTGKIDEISVKIPKKNKVFHFDKMLEDGFKLYLKHEKKINNIKNTIVESDIVTIIYTSGTTGTPKGVMLSHKNILHNIKSLPDVINIQEGKERWLSVLPVWHVFERTIEYIIMGTAGLMAYSKPNARHLIPDFCEIRPTFMVSVPRIWEALYQGIVNKIKNESKVKWFLFNFFVSIGIIYIKSKKELLGLNPLFKKEFLLFKLSKKIISFVVLLLLAGLYLLGDILVFAKIRFKTGGCLRGPISGGGALPEYVDIFFAVIKVEILEGWGLTETAPVIGVRLFEHLVPKTVGPVAPGIEIMIGDEFGNALKNQNEKGIVYIRGDNVMAGYYKEPEKTKAVISKDGWFNTGDLGRLTLTGELQLTGRAKDTIVLRGGENVEPEPIENKLLESQMIHQVMVVGQDKKVLGALIVPDNESLLEYANKKEISYRKFEELCCNTEIIHEYKKIIKHKINDIHGFRNYERITYIKLIPEEFVAGDELTYSLKMKRNRITEKYKNIIESMFIEK